KNAEQIIPFISSCCVCWLGDSMVSSMCSDLRSMCSYGNGEHLMRRTGRMSSLPESPQAAANRERLRKLQSLHTTDAGNAEAFAFLHGHEFRYDHSRDKWLVWNSKYWARRPRRNHDSS